MLEWFRGVIWPRELRSKSGKTVYSYAVVGIVVSSVPISELEGNEFLLDGNTFGSFGGMLAGLPQKEPTIRIGDANMVLTSLDILVEEQNVST